MCKLIIELLKNGTSLSLNRKFYQKEKEPLKRNSRYTKEVCDAPCRKPIACVAGGIVWARD